MIGRISNHARSNVVAYIALFIALTGTAYAAGPLKPGDSAGPPGDLRGTYPYPTIKPCPAGQVLKHDGTAWACSADQGTAALTNVIVRTADTTITLPPGGQQRVDVQCNPGEKATGGGGVGNLAVPNPFDLASSVPLSGPGDAQGGQSATGWGVGMRNEGSTATTSNVRVWALCAS